MKKRGISRTLSTVLVVLLAIVMISSVYLFYTNILVYMLKQAELDIEFQAVRFTVVKDSIIVNEQGDLSFVLQRDAGGGVIDGFTITLEDFEGTVVNIDTYKTTPLNELESMVVEISHSEHGLAEIMRIRVFGVIADVETQREFTSSDPLAETLTPLAEERDIRSAGGGGGGGGSGGNGNNNPPTDSPQEPFVPPTYSCGDGLCTFGEPLTCQEDCVNLVNDPGFDFDTAWSGGSIDNDEGENVLYIFGGTASQTVPIDDDHTSFYLSYRVKPLGVTSEQAITLVPYLSYEDGSATDGLFYNWLRVGSPELGEWTLKEHYIEVGKDLDEIRIQLFAQTNSQAYFDDVMLVPMDTTHETTLTNEYGEMTLGSYGFLKSLTVNDEQQVAIPEPVGNIHYVTGEIYPANYIAQIGTNLYEMSFYDIDTTVQFSLDSGNSFYSFELVDVMNADPSVIEDIEVMRFRPEFIAQLPGADGAAAANAKPDDAAFLNVVPTKIDTLCELLPTHYTCRHSNHEALGWEDGGWALLATTKEDYFAGWEELALNTPAPNVIMDDGVWLKNSPRVRDPYIFPTITRDNYLQILDLTQRGNFRDLLIAHGVREGAYNVPRGNNSAESVDPTNNYEEFYEDIIPQFRDAGIHVAHHLFLGQIDGNGQLVNFTDPSNPDNHLITGDLVDIFHSYELGTLTQGVSENERYLRISGDVEEVPIFAYYGSETGGRPSYIPSNPFFSNNYLIGNEIVRCPSWTYDAQSDSTEFDCFIPEYSVVGRGTSATMKSSYLAGEPFYMIPPQWGPFINPDNPSALQASVNGFWNMMDRMESDYIYVDGFPALPLPGTDYGEYIAISHKRGILPYITERPNQVPHVQLGGAVGTLAWSYAARTASDDAAVFRNKEYTKKHKLEGIISRNNIYGPSVVGLDWWKVHGAGFDQYYDHEAISFDDVDYTMAKSIALDLPVGVQLGTFYNSHQQLTDIFDYIGLYNQLRDEYHADPLMIPEAVISYLSDYENEAEISTVAGWNFIQKDEFREYAVWDESSEYVLNGNNRFGEQPLYFELRPRFDYEGFDDAENIVLLDFTSGSPSPHTVWGEGGASCNLNANGVLTYSKGSGTTPGACVIRVDTSHALLDRRGLGLRMTGNNNRELIVASYRTGNAGSRRDFTRIVDFSGEQTLLFGNPDGDYQDFVDGTMVSGGPLGKPRHWDMRTGASDALMFEIQVRNIAPGSSGQLTFHEFKALKEKNGGLVSPEVTVGSTTLSFPVTLRIDDSSPYLLVYDGLTGEYATYDSNYQEIGSGTVGIATVPSGPFSASLSSDGGDPGYLMRGEFIVRTFDDEDRDGVPTDGSFGLGVICDGTNHFCNDNDPNTFNPDQS